MVKLLVFAILLASSPATGLVEALFRTENICYAGCHSNYGASAAHLDACRNGCDYKLQNEDCATQCKSRSTDEQIQASCQVGCTLSRPVVNVVPEKPVLAIDPVPEIKEPEAVPSDLERPRSIILIRLRQRPSIEMPSQNGFSNADPIQMFNEMIQRFQEHTKNFEQSVRTSFDQSPKEFLRLPSFGSLSELTKTIPIIRIPNNVRADSSSESSEETNDKRPFIKEFKHVMQHPREHQQYLRERLEPMNSRLHRFFAGVRTEWNDLVRNQPKIPVWIFLSILLSSSAIIWYMLMSLCRHTPSNNPLSIRAQELVFHPYEHDAYEKEKIQPDDQLYEVTEPLSIKVKLSNI